MLQLLEKDSPELFGLLEDFDINMSETVKLLQLQSTVAQVSPSITDEASLIHTTFCSTSFTSVFVDREGSI